METPFEFSSGTVTYEIDVMLSANTGRAKHTDVRGAGAFMMLAIDRALRSYPREGINFGGIRYMGDQPSGLSEIVDQMPVGDHTAQYPEDTVRDHIWGLRFAVRNMAEVLDKA